MMEQDKITTPFFQRIWVKYGLIGGIISSLVLLGAYIISTDILFNRAISVITIFVLILFGFLATLEKKKKQGSYITFGDAMATSLGALMLGVVVMSVVNYVLYFIVDPQLLDLMVTKMMENAEESMLKAATPQIDIDKALSTLQNNGHSLILLSILTAPVVIGLFGLIVFLITSAILKKENNTYN